MRDPGKCPTLTLVKGGEMDIPRSVFFFGQQPKKYKVTIRLSIGFRGTYTVEAENESGAKVLACEKAGISWYEHTRILDIELAD